MDVLKKSKTYLLSKLLEKRGIQSPDELSKEERDVYEGYRLVLSGEAVNIEQVKDFCRSQIKLIENKFASQPSSIKEDDPFLKASLHVYLNILKAIEAPEAERASLEKHLLSLIS